MEDNNTKLPEDMLMEIFSKLPTKSIGKCRCLSKQWNSNLSTPEFVKTYKGQENIIILTPSKTSLRCIYTVNNDTVSFNIDLPAGKWNQVIGSYNGLVLLSKSKDEEMLLLNPMTREHLIIPPESPLPHLLVNMHWRRSSSGFGYDSRSHDYKVVMLSYHGYDHNKNTFASVYSVKTGVWKRYDCPTYIHRRDFIARGYFVNGAVHWTSHREDGTFVIVAFDLVNEEFGELTAPSGDDFDVEGSDICKLTVLGGCLCLTDSRENGEYNIWIMKEYGVRESWTKIVSLVVGADSDLEDSTLCFVGDEEVVLVKGGGLVVYNVKDKSLRDMIVDGAPVQELYEEFTCTFVESLLSPSSLTFNN